LTEPMGYARSNSRYIALVAGLTALYLVYAFSSSTIFGNSIMTLDLFFLISALFTILVSLTGRSWGGTVLGTVNAIILIPSGAPFPVTLALIPNGIVFDLAIRTGDRFVENTSRGHFVIAGALGSLVMAISGLSLLFAVGQSFPAYVWAIAAVSNILVGAAGALFGTVVVDRIRFRQQKFRLVDKI